MNLFQLVLKNMRQRSLSTTLTLLSVLLGVALAIGIMILQRESKQLFAQTDFGYEVLIGPPKGSPLQLTLNSVYHIDVSPGVVPFAVYEDMIRKQGETVPAGRSDYRQFVKLAVPMIVGDSVQSRRVLGTTPAMFGVGDDGQPMPEADRFQYRKGKSYAFAAGRAFAPRKFEAVVGADVARELKLHVYDASKSEDENLKTGGAFRVTHGMPGPNDTPDIHKPRWKIVGILEPTGTANDRVLFVPYVSLYAIAEHEEGMVDQALMRAKLDISKLPVSQREAALRTMGIDPATITEGMRVKFGLAKPATVPSGGDLMQDDHAGHAHDEAEDPDAFTFDANGDIVPNLPRDQWAISAIFVKVRGGAFGGFNTTTLMYNFKVIDDRATAVSPASVMREFFDTFLKGSANVLLAISVLVTVVAGASITTTIYNSVSARLREIAILRALGATRGKILALICTEAGLIGLGGGLLGLIVGHALTGVASGYFRRSLGEDIHWLRVDAYEWAYLAAVVVLSLLAGLVPALKAYRTPVATNLVSG